MTNDFVLYLVQRSTVIYLLEQANLSLPTFSAFEALAYYPWQWRREEQPIVILSIPFKIISILVSRQQMYWSGRSNGPRMRNYGEVVRWHMGRNRMRCRHHAAEMQLSSGGGRQCFVIIPPERRVKVVLVVIRLFLLGMAEVEKKIGINRYK